MLTQRLTLTASSDCTSQAESDVLSSFLVITVFAMLVLSQQARELVNNVTEIKRLKLLE